MASFYWLQLKKEAVALPLMDDRLPRLDGPLFITRVTVSELGATMAPYCLLSINPP
ncbi:hypothetical protein [Aeromonas molluscorum]|uniref:hypothetical protein n=1 Tax=Aeromonas molluscorum TaxID=271417 RepID=UPI00039CAA4C|nr:hypothetical protein [Aeromonas molluscorum]